MRFLSFLRRSPDAQPPARRGGPVQDPVSVEGLRARTRRRLIGAAVLVALAVLLLPVVFESAPRPVSDQVAIQMPPRETAATTIEMAGPRPGSAGATAPALLPLPTPAAVPALPVPRVVSPSSSAAMREPAPAASRALALAPSPPARLASAAVAARPTPARAPATDGKAATRIDRTEKSERADKVARGEPADRSAAAAKPAKPPVVVKEDKTARADKADRPARSERKEAPDKAPDKATAATKKPADARVWVQVGAYAEPGTVKTVRQRVDKLGLKSQEQAVQTSAGQRTRVRLGPFASREEADRAAAKLRANGLGASVVSP
ncbi:SPOR domain-containing protein [Sphaerotilus microaerophilus]|uniref:SPOR domain-containing protein n=1 Tax=Sphaerotilus microaerophilus TaxID=2914710 RepID=A0ABM7YLB6_9BURK|nr:SPOR domain-containing protein [Sphaerotilus sp. FB-5]BDI05218.1 hypothetical protein CATMQ487_21880 [Sphaerotilus sp. FB-5]